MCCLNDTSTGQCIRDDTRAMGVVAVRMPSDYCNLQGPASLSILQAILEELSNRFLLAVNHGLEFAGRLSQIVNFPVANN
jgi:hypothetical protein